MTCTNNGQTMSDFPLPSPELQELINFSITQAFGTLERDGQLPPFRVTQFGELDGGYVVLPAYGGEREIEGELVQHTIPDDIGRYAIVCCSKIALHDDTFVDPLVFEMVGIKHFQTCDSVYIWAGERSPRCNVKAAVPFLLVGKNLRPMVNSLIPLLFPADPFSTNLTPPAGL